MDYTKYSIKLIILKFAFQKLLEKNETIDATCICSHLIVLFNNPTKDCKEKYIPFYLIEDIVLPQIMFGKSE